MSNKIIKNYNRLIVVKDISKRQKCCYEILHTIKQMESKIELATYINTPHR